MTIGALLVGWTGALFSVCSIAEGSVLDHWLDAGGWVLLVLGIGVRAWATLEIAGRKRRTVVDSGPYALCRNPLYLGTLFIAVSQLCFLRSLCFLVMLAVPVLFYVLGVVPAEEQYLTGQLGEAYTLYCRETPRWWPQWNRRMWVSQSAGSTKSRVRELRSLVCWVFLPLIAECICYVRELPHWPHWLLLR